MTATLRELVDELARNPTVSVRSAFHRMLVLSSVWVPIYCSPIGEVLRDPTTPGPDGKPTLIVFTDGAHDPAVSYGGHSGRHFLERAQARNLGLTVSNGQEATAARVVVPFADIPAVLAMERTDDPVLGTIVWHSSSCAGEGFWEFDLGAVGKGTVTGVVHPRTDYAPISADELARIRQTVEWVRAHDSMIREHIARVMWDWWFAEYSDASDQEAVQTPEQFQNILTLEVIRFEPDHDAYLVYADHGLVCGYGIQIFVSPDGRFTRGPEMG